jgi:hypothetical protein
MLTGDDLTVQLFIAASALTLLGVAMTQAGWTHKVFVRSLFVLSFGLFGCAIFWKWIAKWSPYIAAAARSVTSGSASWFLLIAAGLGLIFVLDFGARMGWLGKDAAKPLARMKTRTILQYNSDNPTPVAQRVQNIWRWYSLSQVLRQLSPETGAIVNETMIVVLFLVFSEPVAVKQLTAKASGGKLPMYEVKDFGPRHAIIVFAGGLADLKVEVQAII